MRGQSYRRHLPAPWDDMSRWGGYGRRRDERGAVAVFTAFILVVLMGVAALVVDLGMERVTRGDLQALADVVALDLAREIHSDRTQADLAAEGDWSSASSAVRESAARNPDVFGENLRIEVDWGSYDGGVWNTATDPPSAVWVTVSAETNYAIMSGSGEVTRAAYAAAPSSACYRLGSFAAAIRSSDSTVLSPLNYLLGVNLDLASYQALADAKVTLGELAAAPRIGSPERLLAGSLTYSDLIVGMIEVLSNRPDSNTAAINALDTIRAASGSIGSITLGSVLHVAPTDRAALDIALGVLDIVGSARLATGQHLIKVENIQAGVPGVGYQFTGGIALVSAAQMACGKPNSPESVASNAQLQGTLGVEFVNVPSLNITGLGAFQTAKGTGSLTVNVADGHGQLVAPPEVHCGDGTAADPHRFSVRVQTQPASLSLSSELQVTGDIQVSALRDIGLTELLKQLFGELNKNDKLKVDVKVRLDVANNHPGGVQTASLSIPPNDQTPVATGGTVYLDSAKVESTVTAVTIGGKTVSLTDAKPLTDAIVNELTTSGNAFVSKTLVPLIDNINNKLIGPASRMAGLRFGGADVYAAGAVCGKPELWG